MEGATFCGVAVFKNCQVKEMLRQEEEFKLLSEKRKTGKPID